MGLINDETEEGAAEEGAQLLLGLRSYDEVMADGVAGAAPQAEGAPPAEKPKRGRPKGSTKKKKDAEEEMQEREVSVTITGGACDIDPSLLDRMEAFLTTLCLAGFFALERGGTVCHLHLQGVLRMRAKTTRGITAAIRQWLGWEQHKQPAGSRIMCRGLTYNKLHTFVGMLGYCTKDMHEPHFQVRGIVDRVGVGLQIMTESPPLPNLRCLVLYKSAGQDTHGDTGHNAIGCGCAAVCDAQRQPVRNGGRAAAIRHVWGRI